MKVNSKPELKANDSSAGLDKEGKINWLISELNENKQASLEIKTNENPSNLFPVNFMIKLQYSILGVRAKAYDENKQEMLISLIETCETQNALISFE